MGFSVSPVPPSASTSLMFKWNCERIVSNLITVRYAMRLAHGPNHKFKSTNHNLIRPSHISIVQALVVQSKQHNAHRFITKALPTFSFGDRDVCCHRVASRRVIGFVDFTVNVGYCSGCFAGRARIMPSTKLPVSVLLSDVCHSEYSIINVKLHKMILWCVKHLPLVIVCRFSIASRSSFWYSSCGFSNCTIFFINFQHVQCARVCSVC